MKTPASKTTRTIGTGGSRTISNCQVCDSKNLRSLVFIGYLPPVNGMPAVGQSPVEQPSYPAELLLCEKCRLVQLGSIVDPSILFPPSYPYTSGTTKLLRDNFAQLAEEVTQMYSSVRNKLVVDIGSNDGTLLGAFHKLGYPVFGIEPTNAGKIAQKNGIRTTIQFFDKPAVDQVKKEAGKAKVVTCANCFAHMEDVHNVMKNVLNLLDEDGLFITESHYLGSLMETVQYDTIYHEHLRYYSVTSLKALLELHGLEIINVRAIPSHGGSVRVYAARKGKHTKDASVAQWLKKEEQTLSDKQFETFAKRVVDSKLDLFSVIRDIKKKGGKIFGVGAPSRASTLINYLGLHGILDAVVEISGSYKIGKYVPGTVIPVIDEKELFTQQPDVAMLLSWHIADELIPKLQARGFKGQFLLPLPTPQLVSTKLKLAA